MLNETTHDLILECIEYMEFLGKERMTAYKQFAEYTRQWQEERERLKRLEASALTEASFSTIAEPVLSSGSCETTVMRVYS